MQKRPDPREIRLKNLIAALSQNRVLGGDQFGSDEELKEIGLLTMHFTDLEESIALYCEMLLFRPELGGFHQPKPVVEKRFSEKLDLCKTLVIALGVLRTIGTDAIVQEIEHARTIGEDRNSIIHGYLHSAQDGKGVVFRNKQNEVRANLNGLYNLTSLVLQANEDISQAIAIFYKQLVNVAPVEPTFEPAAIAVFESHLNLIKGTIKLRNSQSAATVVEKELVAAKRNARNSRARLKRAEMKLPPEYRDLFIKRRLQLKRCAALADHIKATGTEDPQLEVETVKLKEIEKQLETLKIAFLRDEHERNG